jgi:hypothetical protein
MCSLQTGILKEVIYDRISSRVEDLQIKALGFGKLHRFVQEFAFLLKKRTLILKNQIQNLKDFNTYYETYYFTAGEFNLLYNAFYRIMEIIVEMSKHKSTFKKMHKRFLSSDDAQLEKLKNKAKEPQPHGILSAGNTGSLDSSLNVTTNISVLNISHFKEESITNVNDISVIKSSIEKENENQEEDFEDPIKANKLELKAPTGETTEYLDLLTDKEKNSEKFQNFILEVESLR